MFLPDCTLAFRGIFSSENNYSLRGLLHPNVVYSILGFNASNARLKV